MQAQAEKQMKLCVCGLGRDLIISILPHTMARLGQMSATLVAEVYWRWSHAKPRALLLWVLMHTWFRWLNTSPFGPIRIEFLLGGVMFDGEIFQDLPWLKPWGFGLWHRDPAREIPCEGDDSRRQVGVPLEARLWVRKATHRLEAPRRSIGRVFHRRWALETTENHKR